MWNPILFIIYTPLVCSSLQFIAFRSIWRDLLTITSSLLVFLSTFFLRESSGFQVMNLAGFDVSFYADFMSAIFCKIVAFLWFITNIYAIGYMDNVKDDKQKRFFILFTLAIFCTFGIAFSANLFTSFIFYELLTCSTYFLVVHNETHDALQSGRFYILCLMLTSLTLFLSGILYVNSIAGNTDFIQDGLLNNFPEKCGLFLLALFVFGIAKSAIFPVHFWLPKAMVAPVPVSALLHAVAVVKSGVFILIKVILYIFGLKNFAEYSHYLLYLSGFTIIFSSIHACISPAIKARLAYSTISQSSYIILAASLSSMESIKAAVFHIIVHAFSKITLFFVAGIIYASTGMTYVREIGGLYKKIPSIYLPLIIGSFSIIGLPLTAGLASKYFIISSAIDSNHFIFVSAIMCFSTIISAVYLLPTVYNFIYGKSEYEITVKKINFSMIFSCYITSICIIYIFFSCNNIMNIL